MTTGEAGYSLHFKPTVWAAYTDVWCTQPFIFCKHGGIHMLSDIEIAQAAKMLPIAE